MTFKIVSTFVFAALAICAIGSATVAAPIKYQVEMTGAFDGLGTEHPILSGARLSITYVLDTTGVVPTTSTFNPDGKRTFWNLNTSFSQFSVGIAGTASSDGIYPAAPYVGRPIAGVATTPWTLQSSASGGSFSLPTITFTLNGSAVAIDAQAKLDGIYTDTSAISFPTPFDASKASDWSATIYTATPSTEDPAVNVSGFAIAAPEPASMALSGIGLLSVAALRRRR